MFGSKTISSGGRLARPFPSTPRRAGNSACRQSSKRRTAPNPTGRWPIRRAISPTSTTPLASLRTCLNQATMTTLFGIARLLAAPDLRRPLEGKRIALLAQPASVTRDLTHSLDALAAAGLRLTAAFGPQHGLRGDKQDNMVESDDFTDPAHQIPVFSLYGELRRPSGQAMGTFDT